MSRFLKQNQGFYVTNQNFVFFCMFSNIFDVTLRENVTLFCHDSWHLFCSLGMALVVFSPWILIPNTACRAACNAINASSATRTRHAAKIKRGRPGYKTAESDLTAYTSGVSSTGWVVNTQLCKLIYTLAAVYFNAYAMDLSRNSMSWVYNVRAVAQGFITSDRTTICCWST